LREVVLIGSMPRLRALVVAVLAAAVALTALVAAPGADAKPKKKKAVPVKVMTRNIFLGADLGPGLNATSFNEFTAANGQILAEVEQTDFPRRAVGLATELKQKKPDLVGLQEVAWWRTGPTPGAPHQSSVDPQSEFTATETRFDFLQLLMDQLDAQGLNYKVAVEQNEFDFEAPADIDGNNSNGVLGGDIQGRLTMRDVILVNKDSKVKTKVKKPKSGNFTNLFTPNISGIDVPVTRGWTAVDVQVQKGKKKNKVKKKFRFVNSHFEAFDDETQTPSIRALQAGELLAGPGAAKRTIMLGDFNSDVPGVKPGDDQAFQAILSGGFRDVGVEERASCCVSNLFTSPPSEFDHRVDQIVTNIPNKKLKRVKSEITGREQTGGIYNSDHAGVISTLKLK
jgi:hypothetical protein